MGEFLIAVSIKEGCFPPSLGGKASNLIAEPGMTSALCRFFDLCDKGVASEGSSSSAMLSMATKRLLSSCKVQPKPKSAQSMVGMFTSEPSWY